MTKNNAMLLLLGTGSREQSILRVHCGAYTPQKRRGPYNWRSIITITLDRRRHGPAREPVQRSRLTPAQLTLIWARGIRGSRAVVRLKREFDVNPFSECGTGDKHQMKASAEWTSFISPNSWLFSSCPEV